MGITGAELETYSQKAFLSDPDQDNWLAISSHRRVRLALCDGKQDENRNDL